MLGEVQQLIAAVKDRRKAIRAVSVSDCALLRLRMDGAGKSVVVWISGGSMVVHAKVLPEGVTGLPALLEFLEMDQGQFSVQEGRLNEFQHVSFAMPIMRLISDEEGVIQELRSGKPVGTPAAASDSVAPVVAETIDPPAAVEAEFMTPAVEPESKAAAEVAESKPVAVEVECKTDPVSPELDPALVVAPASTREAAIEQVRDSLTDEANHASEALSDKPTPALAELESSTELAPDEPNERQSAVITDVFSDEFDPDMTTEIVEPQMRIARAAIESGCDLSTRPVEANENRPPETPVALGLLSETRVDEQRLRDDLSFAERTSESASDFYQFKTPELQSSDDTMHAKIKEELESAESDSAQFDASPHPELARDGESGLNEIQKTVLDYSACFTDSALFSESDPVLKKAEEPVVDDTRKRILEIMAEESADPETFATHDPVLADESVLLPTAEAPAEPLSNVAEKGDDAQQPTPDEWVSTGTKSEFGDQLKHPSAKDKNLVAEAQSMELLQREATGAGVQAATVHRIAPGKRLSTRVIVAALAVVAVLPAGIYGIVQYFTLKAQADSANKDSVALLVHDSLDESSDKNRPQEPFRLPAAGPINSSPPAVDSSGVSGKLNDSDGDAPIDVNDINMKWTPKTTPSVPPSGEQLAKASKAMELASRKMAVSDADGAAQIYCTALAECPSYIELREATIRALIAAKQYRRAKFICIGGMQDSPTEAIFMRFAELLKTIP